VIDGDGTVHIEEPLYTSITEDTDALFDTPENADHLDPTVLTISHQAWEEICNEMDEVLGYIDTPLEKEGYVGPRETSGGNWYTGLMLRATASDGVVAAFSNRGASAPISPFLPGKAGPPSRWAMYTRLRLSTIFG
jgi:hypothetical protein